MQNFFYRVAGGRLLAGLAAVAITIAGIWAFRSLPVDAFPDVTPSLVQVFTETEGLAPEEVERYVTYPLETSMSGLPNVDEIRSVSNFGLSVLNIYFEDGTDVYFARQVVGERLAEAREAIPEGFGEPQMGPISTGLGIILYYQLVDDTGERSLIEMREIQDWLIKYQLQSVPGVTEVLSLGGYEKQYQVRIRPDALLRYDVAVGDVVDALEAGNRTAGAQYLEVDSEQYVVRGIGLAEDIPDLGAAILKTVDGTPVRVADVADIAIGGGVRQGLATADGQGEVVAGIVLKLYGTNTSDVIDRAKARFAEINETLPDGVRAVAYYDQATLVNAASSTVTTALWQGALLVAVLIFAFLGGWRPSLVVVLSIPFSVGFAFLGMKLLGVSANLMSLGGVAIAIGMMVDGAIVIAENVDRVLRERPDEDRRTAVAEAVTEVIGPLLAAVAVVIVVFLPLFALQGVEGKTFRPLAASAALAMTGSLIYAGLIAPAIAGWVMQPKRGSRTDDEGRVGRLIRPYAAFFVRRRSAALGLAAVILVLGALVFPRLGSEFTPTLEEGDILLRTTMAPSISLTEAQATMTRVERRILDAFPEVDRVVTRIGRGEVGAHADPTNSGESFLALKPKDEWREGMSPDDLRAALSEELEDFPGILVNVSQPIAMSVDELLTGTKAELAVKIFGPDTDELIAAAGALQGILQDVPGAADVQMDQVTGAPQLQIDLDRQALSRFGITVDQALSTVRAAIGGEQAGTLFEGVRQFPIVVRYEEASRDTPEAVRRLVIEAPGGALVPLEAVADVRQVVGPRQITRRGRTALHHGPGQRAGPRHRLLRRRSARLDGGAARLGARLPRRLGRSVRAAAAGEQALRRGHPDHTRHRSSDPARHLRAAQVGAPDPPQHPAGPRGRRDRAVDRRAAGLGSCHRRLHRAVRDRARQRHGAGELPRPLRAGGAAAGRACRRRGGAARAARPDDGADHGARSRPAPLRQRRRRGSATAARDGCGRRPRHLHRADAARPAGTASMVRAEADGGQ